LASIKGNIAIKNVEKCAKKFPEYNKRLIKIITSKLFIFLSFMI